MRASTTLFVLGTVAVLSGATFGVGGAVQTDADGSVATGDGASPPVTIEEHPQESRYVETTFSDGKEAVKIKLGGDGLGLNANAATTVSPILEVTNRGSEDFELKIKDSSGAEVGLEFFDHETGEPIDGTVLKPSGDGKNSVQIGVKVSVGGFSDHDTDSDGIEEIKVVFLADSEASY